MPSKLPWFCDALLTLGRPKEARLGPDVFRGSYSEFTGSARWYGGRTPCHRFGDCLLILSPTLSRYMILGNSFNCLTIIDYIGGKALELESRNKDPWLHAFLAGRLRGKPLQFFSYVRE